MSTNLSSGEDKIGGGDTPNREWRKPLRQPGTVQATGGIDTQSDWQGGNTNNMSSNALSSLSADAPVFVPRAVPAPALSPRVYNAPPPRAYAPPPPPRGSMPPPHMHNMPPPYMHNMPPPHMQNQGKVGYNVLDRLTTERPAILTKTRFDTSEIHLLKDSMFLLISDPASFDEQMQILVDKFNKTVTDEKNLLQIIDIIYELSIEEVNFRYSGARMCDYLARHMKVKTESGTFRQHLLKKLHQEFLLKDERIKNLNTIPRLHGFTLFVGELFENFMITVDGKAERIHVLRGALRDLVHTLLDCASSENLKCAVNVLKLTGGILEECEQAETQTVNDMDKIFVKLKQLATNDSLHRNIRENLSKLMTLRASGWDRKSDEPQAAQAESGDTAYLYSNEPIFFAPDGRQITAEEAGYYYEEYEEEYYGNDYEYQNWAQDEGEEDAYLLDDEAAADYEQFLRETYHHS